MNSDLKLILTISLYLLIVSVLVINGKINPRTVKQKVDPTTMPAPVKQADKVVVKPDDHYSEYCFGFLNEMDVAIYKDGSIKRRKREVPNTLNKRHRVKRMTDFYKLWFEKPYSFYIPDRNEICREYYFGEDA